jgi:hypothetical protein
VETAEIVNYLKESSKRHGEGNERGITMSQSQEVQRAARYARFMDLRFVLALLFAIFGLIVTVTGILATPEDLEKAAGINISLWTGIALLFLSAFFTIWFLTSPPEVPTSVMDRTDTGDGAEDQNFEMP